MSGSVDDEVVRMRFDNNAFERGVSATLNTLSKLKNALTFNGQGKGLDSIEAKANKFDMSGVSKQIDESARHWSAWKTAGLIAFATVVHRAVNAGINIVKDFTVRPIADGFKSYETQINAAQTIMANTGAKLPVVEGQLKQLQTYAQQTVYNFADMASAIGTFTAAGVKLGPATQAIKGLGNSAALSGVSSERLSGAYIQVSQALSTGVFRLQDWNSLSQAGLGGQNIQKALESTAQSIKGSGPKMDAAIKKYGNFRNSLTSGWLTGNIFNKTMGVMAGKVDKATGKTVAYSVAELEAKGYTKAHAIELNRLSAASIKSATEIRTYTQLTSALKEEVAGAYGSLFKALFGNLNAATTIFSALHNTLENALTGPINHLAALVTGAAKLGARTKAIDAFKNVFKALGNIIKPIKEAFREFFPAATAAGLARFVDSFDKLSKKLIIGKDTMDKLKRTFSGVFAIFYIGKRVIEDLFGAFFHLFSGLGGGASSFLSVTAAIGDFLSNVAVALDTSGDLDSFFSTFGNILSIPISLLKTLGRFISGVFSNFDFSTGDKVSNSFDRVGTVLGKIDRVTQKFANYFAGLPGKIKPAVDNVSALFGKIADKIGDAFGSGSFNNILNTLQVGLLGGIVVMLKKFVKGGLHVDVGGGIFGKLGETIETLTGTLKTMQLQLKSKILLNIAIAIGILAAAAVAFSLVNPKKLGAAMQAMAGGFAELLGSLAVLTKIAGGAGFVKIPALALSLDLLAGALLLLAGAVLILSRLSWEQIKKGLTAVGALLVGVTAAAYVLSLADGGLISAGIGITALAVALNLLYFAVKDFGNLSWSVMLKGLAGVGIALAGIAVAMHLMPKGMLLQSVAILAISVALNGLYFAVKDFATLNYSTILKGLTGIAGTLTAIAIGLRLMPKGIVLQAVGLGIVAGSLMLLYKAVALMAKLSWTQMAHGLAALAGSLVILAVGLEAMTGTLAGAAALTVAALALKLFVPSLVTLGKLKWSVIATGLGALALSFGVIGAAALLLAPVIPAMLALGVALGLVGVAILAFGAGAALLGVGLGTIAASGGAAIGILIKGLKDLIALLPTLLKNVAVALVSFITVIGKNAPTIVGAFVKLLKSLFLAVPKLTPSLLTAFNALIQVILTALIDNAPKIIDAGFKLLMDLLKGIRDNIGHVVTVVAEIIVKFLTSLGNNLGRIIQAGVTFLTKLLVGIAKALGQMPGIVLKVIAAFLSSLFGNFGKLVSAGAKLLGKVISGIGGALGGMISAGVKAVAHLVTGLGKNAASLISAGAKMIGHVVTSVGHALVTGLGDLAGGLSHFGGSIAEGIKIGFEGYKLGVVLGQLVKKSVGNALQAGEKAAEVHSPSRLFARRLGGPIAQGIAVGMNKDQTVVDAARNTVDRIKTALQDAHSKASNEFGNIISDPVITPVLDLTQFSKDAKQIGTITAAAPVNASVSYDQAKAISNTQQQAQANAANVPATSNITTYNFEQTNNSPKNIAPIDTYRHTKNLLAQAKMATVGS